MLGEPESQGDDCLRLNVWAPAGGGERLPVMVWVHGGAYLIGSGSAPGNQGHTFARDGVVFVSMNYRLGALGFLHAGGIRPDKLEASGNYGIADQVAALRWVRDNIAGFGGDPGNVTVLGVSAGGNYTQSLTACPQARGLFRRGISESAGGVALWGIPAHVGAEVAKLFFEGLGVGDPGEADLESLSSAQLLDAQAALLARLRTGELDDRIGDLTVPFYPVSGTDLQPKSVMDAHADGDTAHVDLIIGTNRHEMTIFKLMEQRTGASQLEPRGMAVDGWEGRVAAVYRKDEPGASAERIAWTVEGDRGFRIPNQRAAEARLQGGGRTWMYEFAWESPAFGGRLGAAHGLEVPFVFDDFTTPMAAFLTGGSAPAELARDMHATWISFARTGEPTSPRFGAWPQYDLDRRQVAVFDTASGLVADPDPDRRRSWDGIDLGHVFPVATS